MLHMEIVGTDSDIEVNASMLEDSHSGRNSKKTKLVAIVSSVLLLSTLGFAIHSSYGSRDALTASSADVVQFSAIPKAQANWQINTLERDRCSSDKEDCMSTKCCKTSGHRCIKTGDSTAKCSRYCPKNKPCTIITQELTFDDKERNTMFCFSVYTANTGSTKQSFEKELLTQQLEKKVSIFACDAHAVYSDVSVSLGGGLTTVKVDDVDGDFHFAKRKLTGAWVNTGMFQQVWKAIGRAQAYSNYDWTVKVDPDAVFFAAKLRSRIRLLPIPPTGGFLQNCESVDYGFFGNLEVFSKTAFSILVANVDRCKTGVVSDWKVGIKGGKYGPMGEDLFAEICLRKNGVSEIEAFDITKDGACEAKRPGDQKKNKKWKADCSAAATPAIHPFKKPKEYFECMDAAAPL